MATSTHKGYELQTTGSNSGTWGTVNNTDVLAVIDNNLGAITTKTLSSSNVTLSATESQSAILRLTGTLSGAVQVTTACLGFFCVENVTSGNYAVTLTNGSGSNVIAVQGTRVFVISDGTNGLRLVDGSGVPPGSLMDYAGASGTIPPWLAGSWLFCDGSAVSRTTYALLFAAIGTTWGVGDGSTTFNLPDLRGRVTAGRDDMGGSAASRLTSAGSGVDGATLGDTGGAQSVTLTSTELPAHTHTGTTASNGAHTHEYDYTTQNLASGGSGATFVDLPGSKGETDSAGAHTHTFTTDSTGSGTAFGIMNPVGVVNKLIKT